MARRETTVQLSGAQMREMVLDLRITGMTYADIGKECGISHGKAHQIVTAEMLRLDERRKELARVNLQLDLARLDHLTAAYWKAAIEGDLKSADLIIRVMARRARILGYDNPLADEAEMMERIRKAMFVTQEELSAKQWQAKADEHKGTEEQAH